MSSRRSFLKNGSLLAAGLGLSHLAEGSQREHSAGEKSVNTKRVAPSDRINVGLIGVGMGGRDMRGVLTNAWAHCIAVCDVDKNRMAGQVESLTKNFPQQTTQLRQYDDFRKLLENKDLDGVIIASPDHWHAYMFEEALKAGKAVYVEKPVANSIAEAHRMMEAQAKYKSVVTTGLWQTSQRYFRAANEILKTGVLGDVYKVEIFLCNTTDPRDPVADAATPAHLNYDMWLGPAPQRPYNEGRVRGWRGFWDYGGGQQTDWGVHWIDSAFDGIQALGLNSRTFPKSVVSSAYKHPKSFNETPSCQTTIFEYDNFHIVWSQQVAHLYNRNQGVAWIGSKGTLVCNREGYQLIPEKDNAGKGLADALTLVGEAESGGIDEHATNWASCIRSKSIQTNSPIEKGAFATILAHMANVAYRTGTKVVYDAQKQKFVNNEPANAYLRPTYRGPWDKFWK